MLAAQAVAKLEDAALAVAEVLQRLTQRLLGEDLGGPLVGGLGPLVGDELPELGLLLVTHRLLQRHRSLSGALDRLHLIGLDPGDLRDLLGGRLAAQFGDQLALGATDLVELLDDVHGDADRPGLVRQRAGDGLADPPGGIGGELEALPVVELLRGADQAERALLDQVQERQPLVAVVLGDGDDESQVRLHHLLLGVQVSALDPLGQVDLLLGGEQPDLADVLEEQLQGVGRHVRLEVERGLGLAAPTLVRGPLHLGGGQGRIDLLDELNLGPLEVVVKFLYVSLV